MTGRVSSWGLGEYMSKSTKKRRGEIIQTILRVLADQEAVAAADAVTQARGLLGPDEWELGSYPSQPGVPRIETMIRYGTIGPSKAGWLVKDRGTWQITAAGRQALEKFPDPVMLQAEVGRAYRAWKSGRDADADEEDDGFDEGAVAPPDAPGLTLELAEEAALREIQQHIARINPYDFQKLVAALLRAMGYFVAWVAPAGKDGGVDIVALTDPLGASGPRIKVQVKRHTSGKISAIDLRAFMAVLGPNDVGMFVTSTEFTSEAMAEARQQETRRVSLIGLKGLLDLWIEHYARIDDAERQLLPLQPVYFVALTD